MDPTTQITPGEAVPLSDNQYYSSGWMEVDGEYRSAYVGHISSQKRSQANGKEPVHVEPLLPKRFHLPRQGDVVIAQVMEVDLSQVTVALLASEEAMYTAKCYGKVRKADVQPGDPDTVVLPRCFQPGDLIRARIVSFDPQMSQVSTKNEDLGVLEAISSAGHQMVMESTTMWRCPITQEIQSRKSAIQPDL